MRKIIHWLFDSPEVRFYGLAVFSLILIGVLIPPRGVIDGSLLIGCGILAFLKLVSVATYAIKLGREVSIQHKETKLKVDGKEDDNDETDA